MLQQREGNDLGRVRTHPFRAPAHNGAGSSQLGEGLGANPARQAGWAIHILGLWATSPPCTLGSSYNSNRQEKGASFSPFPGQQPKPEPLPTQQAPRGNVHQAGAASVRCLSSCIIPATQKKGKNQTKEQYRRQEYCRVQKTICFEVPGTQLKNSTRCLTFDWVFIRNATLLQSCNFAEVTSI